MTFSILWVALAGMVTIVTMLRRSAVRQQQSEPIEAVQSAKGLGAAAIACNLVLLAGFLYIGWQHGLELLK